MRIKLLMIWIEPKDQFDLGKSCAFHSLKEFANSKEEKKHVIIIELQSTKATIKYEGF